MVSQALRTTRQRNAAFWLLLAGTLCLLAGSWSGARADSAAQEAPSDPLIQMIVDLLGEPDRDMRALGFQQVREEVPGEAATKAFAALLPKLAPDAQAGLLDALGDRGDSAALPAAQEMLKSPEDAVRAAALRAAGALGGAAEVPLLAEKAAAGSDLEKGAARQSLVRLRGDGVNAAILSAMAQGQANVRAELLGVLAARNAKETLPTVLQSVEDPQPAVRLAAIGALRSLADENDTAALAGILKGAKDQAERAKAELTLLAVCTRGREKCADAIIDGLADADASSREALLRALARAGGVKALEAVVARLKDDDEAVRDEAVRRLSLWRDPAAVPHLLAIGESEEGLRHQVLAIRGLVRLAGPSGDQPADVDLLAKAMTIAKRPEERRLVLGALGATAAPESLDLLTPAVEDSALAEEACLAAVAIAEKVQAGDKQKVRAAMEHVLEHANGQPTRNRAQKVLESL